MKMLQTATLIALLAALAGCASPIVSSGKIDKMSCAELDTAIGDTATAITAAAVSRGKISQTNIPFWVPGGPKVISVLRDRKTGQIERLQADEAAMVAARKARCRQDAR